MLVKKNLTLFENIIGQKQKRFNVIIVSKIHTSKF